MTPTKTLSPRPVSPVHRPHEAPRPFRRSAPGNANLIETLLEYELYSSWWADHIPFRWAQRLAGRYIARKVTRKVARYRARADLAQKAGR